MGRKNGNGNGKKKGTKLAPVQPAGGIPAHILAAAQQAPQEVLPEADPELRTIPRARLLQRMSRDLGAFEPGNIVNSLTGELIWPRAVHLEPPDWVPEDFIIDPGKDDRAAWVVVPLDAYTERIYFEGLELVCRSDRMGRQPLPGMAQSAAVTSCAECPLKEWGTTGEGKRVPPKCNKVVTLVVLDYFNLRDLLAGSYSADLLSAAPVAVSFVRTSFKAGAFLYRMLTLSRPPTPPYLRRFVVWPELVKGDLGEYYVFRTGLAGWVEADEIEPLERLAEMLHETQPQVSEALPSEFSDDTGDALDDEDVFADM